MAGARWLVLQPADWRGRSRHGGHGARRSQTVRSRSARLDGWQAATGRHMSKWGRQSCLQPAFSRPFREADDADQPARRPAAARIACPTTMLARASTVAAVLLLYGPLSANN